jgi:hypothetical protein
LSGQNGNLDGPAEHEGFGSSLVRRLVTGQFGGQLSYDWKPKGLIIGLEALKKPVSLDAIKADPRLAKMALVTNARLSVQPVTSSAPRAAYDAAS